MAQVEELLGHQYLVCEPSEESFVGYFDWPLGVSTETRAAHRKALEAATDYSIVYHRLANDSRCWCNYGDTAIGFRDGSVLWVIPLCGETYVRYELPVPQ